MNESERSEAYGTPHDSGMSSDEAAELEELRREAAVLREQLENAVGPQSGLRSARDVHQLEARIDSLASRNAKLMETLKEARQQLLALPGIGPWTAEVIAMRGLGDPDAFPASDLGLRLAAGQLGLPPDQRKLIERSASWRPWRSYATQHLWTTLEHPVNHWPPQEVA